MKYFRHNYPSPDADSVFRIIANHPDGPRSMLRYAALLLRAYQEAGLRVELLGPARVFARFGVGPRSKKWLAYIDELVIFACRLRMSRNTGVWYHFADHSSAVLSFSAPKQRTIISVHDLIAVKAAMGRVPERSVRAGGRTYQALVRAGLKRATILLPVSSATSADVVEILGRRAVTLSNPIDPVFYEVDVDSPAGRLNQFLVVAPAGWRKGRLTSLHAWTRLASTTRFGESTCQIVGNSLDENETALLKSAGLLPRCKVLQGVDDLELAHLYRTSAALLFLSKYEGFGWPVVEANYFGLPALCGADPALIETVGEGGLCVPVAALDSEDWGEIADKLDVLKDSRVVLDNANRFTWERFASELVQVVFSSHGSVLV